MRRTIKKLQRLSLAEVTERGRQGANILAERIGISSQLRLPTDDVLFQRFDLPGKNISPPSFFEHFRSRPYQKFYASFDDPDATIMDLRRFFPKEEAEITMRADQICEGSFDLLGYEALYFVSRIPDWQFDPVSKKAVPKIHWSQIDESGKDGIGDKKIIWELNRHQYFSTLGRAYWLTKDEKYVEAWIAHLTSWFDSNPPKVGVNWLSSLELAFRSISWIWAFYFFKDSPKFTPDVFVRMLKFLYLQGRHIETYLSTYFSPNTHLTGEALGLYFLGTFLPELKDAARWKDLGYKILMEALDFQVREDGVYCEQSSQYHLYTTDFYANLMILRQLEGFPIEPRHKEKLKQLFEFLLFITQPNGETPLLGDDDGGRFYFLGNHLFSDFRPTLALGAALFGRGELKFGAKEASPELLWLLGTQGLKEFEEIKAVEPSHTSRAFEKSGFFVIRDSWKPDSNFLLIDCGTHGFLNGGHAHADALNFVLCLNGEPIFIDSGTYKYASEIEARETFRSTASHNCLTVDGKSSSVPDGPFSWKSTANTQVTEWKEGSDCNTFCGTHDGFARFGVEYQRRITAKRKEPIVITDCINSKFQHSFELNFILSPDLDAEISEYSVKVIRKKRRSSLLTINTKVVTENVGENGFWALENCLVSSRYGVKTESKKLVFTIVASGILQIDNVFASVNGDMTSRG